MPQVIKLIPYDDAPPKAASEPSDQSRDVLVFLITGNPGLIGYYHPFLSVLSKLLEQTKNDGDALRVHVYGRGLSGFEEGDHEPFSAERPPFDVEAQIVDTMDFLEGLRIEASSKYGQQFDNIILMGHSVGAYIVLEIFNRLMHGPKSNSKLNLQAGILLFPTITHLLQSPSGQRVNRLRSLPAGSFIASHLHQIASTFLWAWPTSALFWFVRSALGMSPHAARATVQFLRSPDAVWQAIYLGQDELRVISENKWTEELWQVTENVRQQQPESNVPKFFFYFGAHDHWVANEYRAKFIEAREEHANRTGPPHLRGRTRIVVDEDDIPHAFCIRKSGLFLYLACR
jgi:pimeloyl-ACP methyl ester carboxylesterase